MRFSFIISTLFATSFLISGHALATDTKLTLEELAGESV
jgi:hypothetical protein